MMRRALGCAVSLFLFSFSVGLAILLLEPSIDATATNSSEKTAYTTWEEYGGAPDDAQYSALNQIDRTNVDQLKQVWFYPVSNTGFRFGSNPIIAHNIMYVVGSENNVVALDASTGKELWTH
jgi:quinoprotein glucose dehydrogenase